MKRPLRLFSIAIALFISGSISAQISGVKNVPGDFASVEAAIIALNTQSISGGPVTINVAANHTETISAVMSLTITGNAANPITFQKSGLGANPLITSYTGGTGSPITAVQDGIWALAGSDYITIDGIDLMENTANTANPATMEYGFAFYKSSATDGCNNNTIKNCVITLNRINNVAGGALSVDGSKGINVVNSTISAATTVLTITLAAGSHSDNKFYTNTIQNCNIGIALIGFADTTPFNNADKNNDIGGASMTTGNTIINYGGGGITSPAAAVRTLAQYSLNVSYNLVNNNNGSGVNHATTLRGIYLNTATSANATVSNNTITIKGAGTTSQLAAIENAAGSTAAGNTINVSNNLITGCTYATATSGVFYGFYNNGATPANLYITGNVFANNSTSAASGSYYPFFNSGAVTTSVNISNNYINSINFTAGATSLIFRGIYQSAAAVTAAQTISSNTLQALSYAGTATGECDFIYNLGTASSHNINNNTLVNISVPTTANLYMIYNSNSTPNNTVTNNFVTGTLAKTGVGNNVYGYYNNGSPSGGTASVTVNNFSNISVTGATTFYGIWHSASTSQMAIVNSNTVSNITSGTSPAHGIYHSYGAAGSSASNNLVTNISGGGIIYGINIGSGVASPGISVNNNLIYQLSSSGAFSTYGIYHNNGASTNIFKNKIYDIQGTNAASTAYGIFVNGGTTVNTFNNLIGDIKAPAANAVSPVAGISLNGAATTTNNVYFNSIYLNATSSGATFGSSAIFASTTPIVNLQNNIGVNVSTANGTGLTVAYRRSSATLTTYSSTSNNNLLFAGTPSASYLIYYDGTNASQTLNPFKTLVTPRDGNSVTENPPFLSTVGSNANFLNINPSISTQVESSAVPVSGITDDYPGNVRNVSTPDIGAWEGNYTLMDITAPSISAIGFNSPGCSLTSRSFTANISDVTGVATGSVAPRAYYKVNAGSYTSVQGVLQSGTNLNGVWSFTMNYVAAVGDLISYYVIAQDVNGNIISNPALGLLATDVNNVSTHPTTPYTYNVSLTLNGTYNVGAGQTFTSVTAAANAYNLACLTGPVTFLLMDATYPNETFPIVFMNNPDASSTNSLLITPDAGLAVTITGTLSTAPTVFKFLNARYITMDGINAGSSLTLNNPNTGTSGCIWMASTGGTGPGNNNLAFRNLNLRGNSTTATGNYGIIAGVDGANPSTTSGMNNDNITISGNQFLRMYHAIYAAGTASISAGGLDNWSVTTNTIGPVSTGTSNIGGNGIFIQNALNFTASNNLIRNIVTSGSAIGGININNGVVGSTVSQNTITNLSSSTTSSSQNSIFGIFLGVNAINATVTKNQISTLVNTNTGGYGARGIIILTSTAASNIIINNNFISDVYSYSDLGFAYWPIGISIDGATGGIDIDFNSVSLSGIHTGVTGATGSAAMFINATGGNLRIRDNIFSNTYDNSTSTTDVAYSIYSASPNTVFNTINHNDYWTTNATLGYINAAVQPNLAAIQASFGGNANSLNVQPVFTSTTDLHLVLGSNIGIDNFGTPIAGITTDIDNQVRNVTTPDMGADEFTTPVCNTPNGGALNTTSISACVGQTITMNSTGFSTGVGTTYQWQTSSTPNGPYTDITTGSGFTTTSYTSAPMGAGVYYIVMKTTCTSSSLSAISNEATVTINATPTATASSNSPICAGQAINLSGGTDVGTTFMWSGPNGYTSTTQNPNIASASLTSGGTYTFTAALGTCTSLASTTSVVINVTPVTISVTPTSATLCAGSSQSLAVTNGTHTMNFGTNANQNAASTSATGYPAPYTAYYGGQRMQMLIQASELSAAGFVSGSQINDIQFVVSAMGSNWGTSINNLINFQVNIGATSASSISAFQPGLTNVVAPMNFTPTIGFNNTHTFSSPYVWDGTSNIILETTWSNNFNGATNDLVTQYNSPTGFQSTIVYRIDSQTSAAVATATTVNFSYSARPDMKINGTSLSTYSWSPAASLSSSTGSSVIASPTTSTVYSITAANGSCSTGTTIAVTVNPSPTVTAVANPTAICSGSNATLTANGATTYSWSSGGNAANETVSPASNATYTVTGTNAGCTGTAVISVSVNPSPTISAVANPTAICSGNSATLTASGATTYSWSSGGNAANETVSPNVNTTYTVTGDNAGCSSSTTISLNVTTTPTVTASTSAASVCAGGTATLTANGATSYTWSTGAMTSTAAITPTAATVYTVTGANGSCTGTETISIGIATTITMAATASSSSVCAGSSATLSANGASTYTWNTGSNAASTVVTPTAAAIYTVNGNSGSCTGSATVALGINTLPTVNSTTSNSLICGPPFQQTSTLTATGANTYTWNPGGPGSSIAVSPSVTTVYTVTGTDGNGCQNTSVITQSVSTCAGIESVLAGDKTGGIYPNPNNGQFTLMISNVNYQPVFEVFDVTGKQVFKLSIAAHETKVTLSELAKGLYTYKITNQTGEVKHGKLILE